jgi:flavin-dependent dehydrogenase
VLVCGGGVAGAAAGIAAARLGARTLLVEVVARLLTPGASQKVRLWRLR